MVLFMTGNGRMDNKMARELIPGLTIPSTRDNGRMASEMDSAFKYRQTDLSTKDNGNYLF